MAVLVGAVAADAVVCCRLVLMFMVWWQNTKTRNMPVDLNNHSRWKHKWVWHNRGCVWDKIASDWAGHEEWSNNRQGTL